MTNRRTPVRWLSVMAAAILAAMPGSAHAQNRSPIDDLIRRAMDAFNDLQYSKADSIAKSVLQISTVSAAQRANAQMVVAASAYPEGEPASQHRAAALSTLKLLVRSNFSLKLPPELTWAGLDSLLDEAKRTTFSLQVSGDAAQTAIGVDGMAKLHVRSNKPGFFRVIIAPKTGSGVAVVDSVSGIAEGDIQFKAMRDEKPIFSTGDYVVTLTAFEPGGRGDTVTVQYDLKVDAPALTFATVPTKMDSTKLLKERSGKFGAKAIFPGLLVAGAAFALSSVLHGEGGLKSGAADGMGVGVAGGMFAVTLVAGFADHGRLIPDNIAANRAAGEAFQKSVTDAQAENKRRIVEYKTVLTFDMGGR